MRLQESLRTREANRDTDQLFTYFPRKLGWRTRHSASLTSSSLVAPNPRSAAPRKRHKQA